MAERGKFWTAMAGDEAPDGFVESRQHSEATARGQAER